MCLKFAVWEVGVMTLEAHLRLSYCSKGICHYIYVLSMDSLTPHQSVQSLSHVQLFATPWTAACQASLSSTNSSQTHVHWVDDDIQHLLLPFFSCPQSLPASRPFPMSRLFASGGQSIGASASASVLPMNIQEWFPLGLTSLISLQSKGLSRVFSNTTVQKHQFFGAQPSLWSNCHIHT